MMGAAMLLVIHIAFTEAVPVIPDAAVDLMFALVIASIPDRSGHRDAEVPALRHRPGSSRRRSSTRPLTVDPGAAYVGLVLAGQALFSSFAGGSNLAIAASTLVVAALFLPVRSRVQRFVDRRFYRRRYDAQRTLERFGARLREQIDLETLEHDLQERRRRDDAAERTPPSGCERRRRS